MELVQAALRLNEQLAGIRFGKPVTHVYNPLEYAGDNYAEYAARYGRSPKEALFIGMNPGPFGMAQTGVPFGDVVSVREWLGIDSPVGKPAREHPKRKVEGLACKRVEVSGTRLWGAARARFETPERFFDRFFVDNYCPLVFMESSGRNRTPDKLPVAERGRLFEACDRHLREIVDLLRPEIVIGVGAFAEARAAAALEGSGVRVGRILHPSPASPLANKDWSGTVGAQLRELGVCGD